MIEPQYPEHTAIRHKKQGYGGWIYDTTTQKNLFTGNTNCEWQYRIEVKDLEKLKIAPEEDLELVDSCHELPPSLLRNKLGYRHKWRAETTLHQLGYQITGKSREERWRILVNVAIPHMGVHDVIMVILTLMHRKLYVPPEAREKSYALIEWNYDLDILLDKYDGHIELKSRRIQDFIKKVKELYETLA